MLFALYNHKILKITGDTWSKCFCYFETDKTIQVYFEYNVNNTMTTCMWSDI